MTICFENGGMAESESAGESVTMTDLTARLQSANGAEIAQQIRDRLCVMQEDVARKLEGGVSAQEYKALGQLSEALASAHHIMLIVKPSPA